MSLTDRWSAALDDLRRQDRFRSFARPLGHDFTSNDYLGYGNGRDPSDVVRSLRDRTSQPSGHGVTGPQPGRRSPDGGYSDTSASLARSGLSSRLLRGHHEVWDEVEARLAAWHGAEAVLMMTSGYAANEGLLSTVLEPGDWVALDELSHACIHDGLRLAKCRRATYQHNDLNHLEDILKTEATKPESGRERFVVTESVFSMDGDRAPLREIVGLAERYGAHVIVDEAHSTGCYGPDGSGCVDEAGVRDRVLATVHTGGKALAVPGAYIAGSRLLKDYLVNRCRHLIFTTALPAECGRWWLDMLPKVQSDGAGRATLRANAARFRAALAAGGVSALGTEFVVPVVLGDNGTAVRVARRLQEQRFDVRAIRPPSVPPGTARVRISVHADHDADLLDRLAAAVAEAVQEAGP